MQKVEIRIAGPLPAHVLLTLTRLIGAAWPDATMSNSSGSAAVFMVDPTTAPALDEDLIPGPLPAPGGGDTLNINSVGPEGISVSTPADVANALLPVIRTAFEEFPEAENYVEFAFADPAARDSYVLLFCRSSGQTPHALRLRAEADLVNARSDAHRENAAAVRRLLRTPVASRGNTFEEGVKAALEAMRAPDFGVASD